MDFMIGQQTFAPESNIVVKMIGYATPLTILLDLLADFAHSKIDYTEFRKQWWEREYLMHRATSPLDEIIMLIEDGCCEYVDAQPPITLEQLRERLFMIGAVAELFQYDRFPHERRFIKVIRRKGENGDTMVVDRS